MPASSDAGGAPESLRLLVEAVKASGLIKPESPGVVLLSGGPDSVALLAGLVGFSPGVPPVALHLNYGLRAESGHDEAVCVEACEQLGVELLVRRAGQPEGNLQAWARQLRYSEAERLRGERGADWIAVGHTMSDVAETVLYRLASSPGRRAIAAMAPRSGFVVRPLLSLTRAETRAYVEAAGLPFADDISNLDPSFSRVRIRNEVLPVMKEINPGAEANLMRSRTELLEEGDLLEGLAAELLDKTHRADGYLDYSLLATAHPALRRLVLRQFAEEQLGQALPVSIELADSVHRIAADPEGGAVDLGGGASFRLEAGLVAVAGPDEPPPDAGVVSLDLPGQASWDGWLIRAELSDVRPGEPPPAQPDSSVALLDMAATGEKLTVRGWRSGDRIQPLGMDGHKSLQDLFTDQHVPRSARHHIPVLLSGEDVVWVAGLTVGQGYRLTGGTGQAILVRACRPGGHLAGSKR